MAIRAPDGANKYTDTDTNNNTYTDYIIQLSHHLNLMRINMNIVFRGGNLREDLSMDIFCRYPLIARHPAPHPLYGHSRGCFSDICCV